MESKTSTMYIESYFENFGYKLRIVKLFLCIKLSKYALHVRKRDMPKLSYPLWEIFNHSK